MDKTDQKDPFVPQTRYNGLSYLEYEMLAQYNGERARGLVHTSEWDAKMAPLQERFRKGDK
jgi:hypothetical protein